MPDFQPFDLGRVIQTAEAIKGMRREEENDRLRNMYMGVQTDNARQAGQIAAAQEQRAATVFTQEHQIENTKLLNAAAAEVMTNPAAAERWLPQLQQAGVIDPGFDWRALPPEQLQGAAKQLHESTSAALAALGGGNAPKFTNPEPGRQDGRDVFFQTDERGNVRVVPGVEPRPQVQPQQLFVTLNPDQVASAGLPAGTSAQQNTQTGEIRVLSKRDNTSTLSQKDQTTAKLKLQTVQLARAQLNDIRAAFSEIENTLSAGGGGQGLNPSVKGQAFDRAVDQMRSTLTALTRVPGVGAMSDYETKLDQAKFPSRRDYEEVTKQQIDAIEQQLKIIESGYNSLLGNEQQQPANGGQQPPAVVDWSQLK